MLNLSLAPILAFWPFASGAMLFWGLTALAPLLIHLWTRRRRREVPWAAMEYLLAAMKRHARRILIEQWVLLAIRTSILLLFAIALAQPVWTQLPALSAALGGGRTHWVIVLDVSYSMGAQDAGQTRFDKARQQAADIVKQSRQGDGFTLVTLADAPQAVIRTPAFDSADVLEEIDALKLTHGGARLSPALAEVEAIVVKAAEQHTRLQQTQVCIVSDLGRTTWDDALADDVRARLARLAEKATLTLIDVGAPGLANTAITRLDVRQSFAGAGRDSVLEVDVQNFAGQPAAGRQLEIFVNGRRTHVAPVELRTAAKGTFSFKHAWESPGETRVEARLTADALPIDDHRYASVPVREAVRVLCVQGAPREAQHLALALSPDKSPAAFIKPEVVSESALTERDLSTYDVVFLANIARFSRDEASVLNRYVRQGGGLALFLGDQVHADSYNEHLAAGDEPLLPARLGAAAATREYRFDPLAYRHPLLAEFAGHERAGLLTTPVWKYIRLTPLDKSPARVALAFDNGDPALVTAAVGRGRVALLATAASTQSVDRSASPPTPWTALSTWPSFPPLVQELLSFLAAGRTRERQALVGEDLAGTLPAASAPESLVIQAPSGQSERVPLARSGEDAVWSFGETEISGFYEVKQADSGAAPSLYAVNVNAREGDLERIDAQQLPETLQRDLATAETFAAGVAGGGLAELFRAVLGGVLALLLVETVLAWRLGSGAR